MYQQEKEQIGTFVEGLIEIHKPNLSSLSSRMRYQRALLREVLMFWPGTDPVEVVSEVIGPVVARTQS